MRINRFEVKGLHGFIDAELDFFDKMTVVVGRNGAGKTSVLDLISSLIRLDEKYLSNLVFESARLDLDDKKGKKLFIAVEPTEKSKELVIGVNGKEIARRIISQDRGYVDWLIKYEAKNLVLDTRKKSTKEFLNMLQSSEWEKAKEIVRNSTHLTFVRLDRTIMAYDSDGTVSVDRGSLPSADKSDSSKQGNPIDDVNRVMRRNNLMYRRKADRIQREASADLIKLHFLPPKATLTSKSSTEKALRQKISELRKRVSESRLIASAPDIESTISEFFEQFELLLEDAFPKKDMVGPRMGRRTLQEETLEVMIKVKEHQISELLKIFQREQDDTAKAYESIKRYLDVASRFLKDSGKRLGFSTESLELAFGLTSRVGMDGESEFDTAVARPIRELSSGEKQILIVLTYLAFLAGGDSIFVIDEPELSLHVRWQAQLIDALRELQPDGCQIILATHAPEIAGKAKESCRILRPSYLDKSNSQGDVLGELNG